MSTSAVFSEFSLVPFYLAVKPQAHVCELAICFHGNEWDHKPGAGASLQAQGEDGQQKKDLVLFQVPTSAYSKSHLLSREWGEGRGLNWTESFLVLLCWEMKAMMIMPCGISPFVKESQLACYYCVLVRWWFQFAARALYSFELWCTRMKIRE